MSTLIAGLVSGYGAWRTVRWLLPRSADENKLDRLCPEDWLKQTDISIMLFTLEFYTRKHAKKPYIKALEEQRKKVDELLGRVHEILNWKNDGWHYAYRSWAWTGEEKAFARLKEEHAVLIKRLELLKQLEN